MAPTKRPATESYETSLSEPQVKTYLSGLTQEFSKASNQIPSSATQLRTICGNIQSELQRFNEYYQKKDTSGTSQEVTKIHSLLTQITNSPDQVFKGVNPENVRTLLEPFQQLNRCFYGIKGNIENGTSILTQGTGAKTDPVVKSLSTTLSVLSKVTSLLESHSRPH